MEHRFRLDRVPPPAGLGSEAAATPCYTYSTESSSTYQYLPGNCTLMHIFYGILITAAQCREI